MSHFCCKELDMAMAINSNRANKGYIDICQETVRVSSKMVNSQLCCQTINKKSAQGITGEIQPAVSFPVLGMCCRAP